MAQIGYIEKLVAELDTLVDKNGKVKSGYEDRVKFILSQLSEATGQEWKLIDGTIKKYGELKENINELINKKKAEIILEANQQKVAEAIENQAKAYELKKVAHEKLIKVLEKQTEAQEKLNNKDDYASFMILKLQEDVKEANKAVEEATVEYSNYANCWEDNVKTITYFEDLHMSTVTGNNEEIEKSIQELSSTYKTESGIQIETLKNQIEREIDSANTKKKIWKETGKEINKTEEERLNSGINMLAEKLAEQTKTVENLTPENIEAWKILAEKSQEIYNEKLSKVDEDTRFIIETATNTIGKLTPEQVKKWADLAQNNKTAYDNGISGLDAITSQRIQSCVEAINNKKWTAEETAKGLASVVEGGVNTIDTTEAGRQAVNGVAQGINQNKNSWSLWESLRGLKNTITNGIKDLLGIHSPSTVLRDMVGKFIPLGIAEGIDKEAYTVYASMKNLGRGIEINTKDYMLDTSQYVDYGSISGNITTQTNVNMNNNMINQIGQACYNAFINAMRDEGVKVDIEAKSDEGIIFTKVQAKAMEYVMQRGENPFPIIC